ncbi:MAG: ABC transporter substrate-binding protein [Spirochaetota bacterium]|nr:ABC transporter substrate-binding protein [Spirochaetota bacterium]
MKRDVLSISFPIISFSCFSKWIVHLFLCISVCMFFILIMFNQAFSKNVRGVTKDVIKIACVADQTGPIADIGIMLGEAPKHYLRYINEQGGINGRKFKYYLEDGRYSAPIGIAAFKKLVFKDEIFAIMGPYCTATFKALMDQIEKHKVPNLWMAPQPILVNPIKEHSFTTGEFYHDDFGVLMEYIMKELKPKNPKIAFCTLEGESGREVLISVKKWAALYNLKVHKEVIPLGAMEVASQVLRMKQKHITHVLVHHSAPGAAVLLRELRKFRMNIPVYSSLLACTEDTVKLAGVAAKRFIGAHGFSSWYDDTPGMKELRKITLKYCPGTEEPWRTKSYTGSWVSTLLLCEAIKRAGKNITAASCIKSIESLKNFDTKGLSGRMTFSPTRHKGMDSARLFKADPSSGKLIPMSEWRNPPKIR